MFVKVASCIVNVREAATVTDDAVLVNGETVDVTVGVLADMIVSVCVVSVEAVAVDACVCVTAISVALDCVIAIVDVRITGASVIILVIRSGGFPKKIAIIASTINIKNMKIANKTT